MNSLTFKIRDRELRIDSKPLVMGVLNVTPDSFSDGGNFLDPERAVEHALAMIADGADMVDIGGESTRPGAAEISPEEEIARVCPVIERLSARTDVPISIDTRKGLVAREAVSAGAVIINDVSGFRFDRQMVEAVKATGAGYIGMHMRGTPATMQSMTDYNDVMGELHDFFREMLVYSAGHGIDKERVVIDPGIGFGKTAEQNLQIIRELAGLRVFARPILMGVSRKSFIGKALGIDDPGSRLWGTAAAVALSVWNGASILRVHDVREMRQVVDMTATIMAG